MTPAEKVSALLDEERASIREGRLEGLADLSERKAALFSDLARSGCDAETLASLRHKADHNRTLLEAARRGLGAALTQIGAAKAAANPRTYGPKGERDTLGPQGNRFEKRC